MTNKKGTMKMVNKAKKAVTVNTEKMKTIEILRGTIGYFYTRPDGTEGFNSCEAGYIAEMNEKQAAHFVEVGVAKYVDEKKLAQLKAKAKKVGIPVKANWSATKILDELEKKGS